jgi:RNA polymerase sigma-70 factor (ECF subfamily)
MIPVAEPAHEVPRLAERLFREEWGRLVASLARHFGVAHLQLAEDVVQEALARALRVWPYYGIPKNPAGWLMQTARNLALDAIRREKNFSEKQPAILAAMHDRSEAACGEEEIGDSQLRLLFVCCHPRLAEDVQVALALKTLCGFNVEEISSAFFCTAAAMAKKLTRAKQKLKEEGISFEIPAGPELPRRLDSVLQTLYLLFNEGYKASSGDRLVRDELCIEAIRLALLLLSHPATAVPKVHALVALMHFNASRLASRIDGEGALLRLDEQDRSRWDVEVMARGFFHLERSAAGDELTAYHLQAGIAACHCAAPDAASTDWRRILSLYDRLAEIDPSPVVMLNRAIALGRVEGPRAALAALGEMRDRKRIENYHLLHAVQAEFELAEGLLDQARASFERALRLVETESERRFLLGRQEACGRQGS